MAIFIIQFKVKPEPGHHLTAKYAYCTVYVRAINPAEAEIRAREYVAKYHWIVSSIEADAFAFDPELHDLTDETLAIYQHAQEKGAAMGTYVKGIDPDGTPSPQN